MPAPALAADVSSSRDAERAEGTAPTLAFSLRFERVDSVSTWRRRGILVSEVKDDVFAVNARRRGESFVFASENVTNGRVELEDSSARANRRCTFPSDTMLVFASTSSALQPATKSCGKPSQAISPSAVLMVRACLMPEAIWEE